MTDHPFAAPSRRDLFKAAAVGLGAVGGAAFFPTIANADSGEAAAVIPSNPNHDYFLKLHGIAGDSSDDLFSGQFQPLPSPGESTTVRRSVAEAAERARQRLCHSSSSRR